jgi:hypothetical protein
MTQEEALEKTLDHFDITENRQLVAAAIRNLADRKEVPPTDDDRVEALNQMTKYFKKLLEA